ncbi:MAG: hypothetical protein R3Y28_08870, partial [Candidatus Gastranaerophilales bacterium]
NKILENLDLMNNKNFADMVGYIIGCSSSAESAKAKIDIMDKIIENPDLMNNKNFADMVGDIISSSNSAESAKAKIDIMDKIIENPDLMNNKNFADMVGNIISYSDSAESAKARIDVIDKFANDPKILENNPILAKHIGFALVVADGDFTMKSLNNYAQALDNAYAKKLDLKPANEDLSDEMITKAFLEPDIVKAVEILGVSTFTHSYKSKLSGVVELAEKVSSLKNRLSHEDFNALMHKINPKNTSEHKALELDLANQKAELEALKTPKMKEVSNQLAPLFEEVTALKAEKTQLNSKKKTVKNDKNLSVEQKKVELENIKIRENEIAQKMNELNSQLAPLIKELNSEKSSIEGYTAKEVEIKDLTTKMRELSKVELDPQSIIDKTRVISAITEHNINDAKYFIDLVKAKKGDSEQIWNSEIEKYVFKTYNIEYITELAGRMNLGKSKYIGEMLSAKYQFKDGFEKIINQLKNNPNKTVEEIFNELPQNLQTRKMFEELNIDYNNWVKVNPDSFVEVKLELKVEEARKKSIESFEEDLASDELYALPQENTVAIFDKLKTELNIELKEVRENVYDDAGMVTGTVTKKRLYKKDEPIEFRDLAKAVRLVQEEVSKDCWTTAMQDQRLNSYRETMLSHLSKERYVQMKTAEDMKADRVATLEIRKTDMNDIEHALFLGNHGSCCTAVGTGCNEFSAPTYVMNKMISAIEVVDDGNFVGNTMCYIAKVDGKPALILDNIELKADYHGNDKLRDAMLEYAKKMTEEIGQPDMAIYAGPFRHKVNMDVLPHQQEQMQIIGSSGNDDIYLDFITRGREVDGKQVDNVELFKIR